MRRHTGTGHGFETSFDLRHRLPPLTSLRLFEAAARHSSFKRAAEELLLTPSAVSHGIQTLEGWLGTELFRRMPRGLVLTEAGRAYFPVVRDALATIAAGAARISSSTGTRLAISAAPTFAARWVLPRLSRFRRRHPEIAVTIDTAHEPADLANTEIDLAIRMGRGDWDGVVADRLFMERLLPVATPAVAARVRDLRDIEAAPLIHLTTAAEDWAAWAAAAGRPAPDPARGLRFDTIQMAIDAALQGLGVAIGRKPLVNPELRSGKLVQMWPPEYESRTAYWLVCAPARADEPAIKAFRSWILDEIGRR